MKKQLKFAIWFLINATFIFGPLISPAAGIAGGQTQEFLATKESRRVVVSTDAGGITAVDVSDGRKYVGSYHLEFFTLDTGSLFLPVLLHTDMVFYVHTGRGTISWIGKKRLKFLDVEPGDIYRLEEGTVFYIQSSSDTTREKLRIHAIFKTFVDDENPNEPFLGAAYSTVIDLVRGFDVEVLQTGFGVSEEVIEEIKKAEKPPPIIHFETKRERDKVDWREGVFEALLGRKTLEVLINDKKKKAFNIMRRKPDVENKHGISISVTHKDAKSLKGSFMGMFMVNLTKSSMVGPHWNPDAAEVAIVERGHGMVQVVSASNMSGLADNKCATMRFYVKEGDVFVVPRFHPMAQMSFENESFVFVGFSTNVKKNHPQFLAGKWSVLRTMNTEVLAAAFNVTDAALDQLLAAQEQAVLLGCERCAEEVQKKLEAEIERKKREEERRRQEEEERERKEEARKREEERREEEEARRRKEEERREEEEAEKREEKRKEKEEAKKREEEKREEEEAQKRAEEEEEAYRRAEEAQRRAEEEAQRREEERREEEEARRRKEEERRGEEEAKKREEKRKEKEEAKKREEEKREEEEAQKRREEEEEAQKIAEEEEKRREEEEEAQRRAEEESQRRAEEEAQREEEEEAQRRAEEEKAQRRGEEEEAQRRKAEEAQRREEEEEAQRREGGEEEEGQRREGEEEEEEQGTRKRREGEEEAQRERKEEEEQWKLGKETWGEGTVHSWKM